MLNKLISSLTGGKADTAVKSKRAYPRREGDQCVTVVNGKMYPVQNWSNGGLLITADDRMFGVSEEHDVTIKFKLRDEVMDVTHKAKIIRKSSGGIAMQFLPLTSAVQGAFQRVVDDILAQNFSESQLI
jgi:hypothetical protein